VRDKIHYGDMELHSRKRETDQDFQDGRITGMKDWRNQTAEGAEKKGGETYQRCWRQRPLV
jgi:hypothetical protein